MIGLDMAGQRRCFCVAWFYDNRNSIWQKSQSVCNELLSGNLHNRFWLKSLIGARNYETYILPFHHFWQRLKRFVSKITKISSNLLLPIDTSLLLSCEQRFCEKLIFHYPSKHPHVNIIKLESVVLQLKVQIKIVKRLQQGKLGRQEYIINYKGSVQESEYSRDETIQWWRGENAGVRTVLDCTPTLDNQSRCQTKLSCVLILSMVHLQKMVCVF